MKILGRKFRVGLKKSAVLPGIMGQSNEAGHAGMCKLEDEERSGFRGNPEKSGQWIKAIENARTTESANLNDRNRRLISSLH